MRGFIEGELLFFAFGYNGIGVVLVVVGGNLCFCVGDDLGTGGDGSGCAFLGNGDGGGAGCVLDCGDDIAVLQIYVGHDGGEDIAGGGTFTARAWRMEHNNELAVRTAIPACVQIQFGQYGEIVLDSKTVLNGSLDVDYYEMRSEWLAKQLFREIQHTATLSRGKYREYQENQIPDLNVDQAAAYTNYYPTLLLRQGNKVLRVRFMQLSQTVHVAQEQWMPIFAERLLNAAK